MKEYKFTKEDLDALSKKIYEEACCGYLDLKDVVCDRIVTEFLDGKEIVENKSNPNHDITGGIGTIPMNVGSGGTGGNVLGYYGSSTTVSASTYPWSIGASSGTSGSYTFVASGNTISLTDTDVSLRSEIDLRNNF